MSSKLILACASCVFALVAMAPVMHHHAGVRPNISSTVSCTDVFPAPSPCLASARDTKNRAIIKRHAWELLERFGQDSLQEDVTATTDVIVHLHPAWERWSTKCSLQLSTKLNCLPGEAKPNKNWLVVEGRVQQALSGDTNNSGPPPYSSVYYNGGAKDWILNNKLNSAAELFHILKTTGITAGPGAPTMIPVAAHPDSAIVKEIWAVISPDTSGTWNVPVYPTTIKRDPLPLSLDDVYMWSSKIPLKQTQGHLLDTTSDCQSPNASSDITANCFVYRYAPKDCSKIRDPFNGPVMAEPNLAEDGPCIFLLLGVQIMTHESLPNWTWNTYWWTENTKATPNAPGWDAKAPEGFKHFEMATMLSPDSVQTAAAPQYIFNPYLEGPMPKGTTTNCLLCHSQASYIPDTDQPHSSVRNGKPLRTTVRISNTQNDKVDLIQDQPTQTVYKDCTPEQRQNPATNNCRLRTALLWSLATNQDRTAGAPN